MLNIWHWWYYNPTLQSELKDAKAKAKGKQRRHRNIEKRTVLVLELSLVKVKHICQDTVTLSSSLLSSSSSFFFCGLFGLALRAIKIFPANSIKHLPFTADVR
jgi:hypothetical protein